MEFQPQSNEAFTVDGRKHTHVHTTNKWLKVGQYINNSYNLRNYRQIGKYVLVYDVTHSLYYEQ